MYEIAEAFRSNSEVKKGISKFVTPETAFKKMAAQLASERRLVWKRDRIRRGICCSYKETRPYVRQADGSLQRLRIRPRYATPAGTAAAERNDR